ncbi:hypothetical protein D3C87_2170640 [compost metagenome]
MRKPSGKRSSCAIRSKRGKVMPKVARKRVRTSFSILTVHESMRSHSLSDW